jgi:outer membrane protein assembly factor BamB
VAVGLVTSGWLVWRHETRFHEHVSAAQGGAPTALGSGAPAAPDRMVRRTSDSYGVDGGLSIDTAGDGIVARDLRTGKDYWRYGRDGTELGKVGFTGDGDVVASWWKDGVVVATDVRTGKPRWHAQVSYGDPDGSSGGFAAIRLVGGLVLTESRDELTAFAADDGTLAWHAAIPEGCGLDSGGVLSLRDAVVARARCTATKDAPLLLGFDVHRGTLRWRVNNGLDQLLRADDHTLVTSAWTAFRTGAAVDVSGSEPAVRTLPFPDDHPLSAAGGGVMVSQYNTGGRDLEAFDIASIQPQWTRQPAAGTRFGQPLIADGRVYVVQQPGPSPSGTRPADGLDLIVLDARTGRQLHSTRLPAVPPAGALQDLSSDADLVPWQADAGVVVVGWAGTFLGLTGDLLVVSQ